MLTDAQIKASALNLYANGITPSVRKIAADLGGGDWSRISRILRELNLGKPNKPAEPTLPAHAVSALKRLQDEAYERGKADAMRSVEDYKRTIETLEAQIRALKEALAEQESVARAASPKQIRSIVEDALTSFLGEVKPDKLAQKPKPVPAPAQQAHVRQDLQSVTIDGWSGTQIIRARADELTPAQLEWKRQYHREADARRRDRATAQWRQAVDDANKLYPRASLRDTVIDGKVGTQIMKALASELTPAQLEWRRRYQRDCANRRVAKFGFLCEQNRISSVAGGPHAITA